MTSKMMKEREWTTEKSVKKSSVKFVYVMVWKERAAFKNKKVPFDQ